MNNKELEYKEMFLAEALDNYEELNKLFVVLEKNNSDNQAIDSIFRITHTLKGNAMGLGFEQIADLGHIMESVFSEIKKGTIKIDAELFNNLYKANDKLGQLLEAINSGTKVSYKGIRTKLEVYLKNNSIDSPEENPNESAEAFNEENEPLFEENDNSILENLEEEQSKISFSDQVSIPVRKLDNLLNLVGELIIEKDSLMATGQSSSEYSRLHRITSDLQYSVMDVRLVQIGFMFNKFHRVLRDVATIENKEVELVLEGTEIEIDRNILKVISDSMVHLVRNAVSHGIEKPDERIAKGKNEIGKVTLSARNAKDTVFIDVTDDGAGIDVDIIRDKAIKKSIISKEFAQQMTEEEVIMCIFEPGFSNAETITEVSGRGVGMDVVKRAVESIGGRVHVKTTLGKGSSITLSLPSSMAVKGALLFEMENQEYAIPLAYTESVVSLLKKDIHKVSGGLMASYLDKTLSIIFLNDLYHQQNEINYHKTFNLLNNQDKLDVLVVSYEGKYIGFVVDKLLQQKEIVEKTLSKPLDVIPLFSGVTILGNGSVCLVLDVAGIINTFLKKEQKALIK